jgi:peroxisomal membrane protein 2
MNWKVWTPFQFININYVAVEVSSSHWLFFYALIWNVVVLCYQYVLLCFQFRVLFANMVALFWYAYLASVRK